jgi:alkanesulfonate monooxygenase SsuD/methylene tetrahydromethanopterin reductase-like flavin-dependent oxidoreductase (luciferase family)
MDDAVTSPLSPSGKPALSLVATPGKRTAVLDAAAEAERRGFAAIACPTLGGALGLCVSLAHVTHEVPFYTSIQGIYGSVPSEIGGLAAHIHEVSGGRFALGLGVSHEPMVRRLGVPMGRPLADMRRFVDGLRANERYGGPLPPIYLAALRDRMLDLAVELGDGAIWANASFQHTAVQVQRVPAERTAGGFRLANMIPTVIDDDRRAAAAVNRKTMTVYVGLPNYRSYWRSCGYVEEMDAIEAALAAGERDRLPSLMSDAWLDDCTLGGPVGFVRERLAAWAELGVQPIAVMSSTRGGQLQAVAELFDAYQ